MITAAQKKALTAAGYTVKGNTVQNKSGGTVGGYNKNGNIFSGSSTVRDILKSKPEAAKPAAKKTATKAPTTRPKARPAPAAKDVRRAEDKAAKAVSGASRSTAGKVKGSKPVVDSTSPKQPTRTDNEVKPIRVVRSGDSAVSGASRSTKGKVAPKDKSSNTDKAAAALTAGAATAAAMGTAARKARRAARVEGKPTGSASNPSYGSQRLSKEGFQGKYETRVGKPGGRGATLKLGRANGRSAMDKARDPLQLMNKGGMVKGKKKC